MPIDPTDLRAIAQSLRTRDVFTPTFLAPEADRYDPALYRHQAKQFNTSTRLLVDRNVLTRWADLVRGGTPAQEHRLAAGILSFAQCADIDVEPNIALYELAHTAGQDASVEELNVLRIADHVHPGYWAEIALGRADSLGPLPALVPIGPADADADFTMSLRRWRRNYILALKIAELELRGGSSTQRMSELIAWMYWDFLLGGPALVLAAHYLAPNANRKGLLKDLRASDREQALAGVRNAAWDLTILSEWIKYIGRQEPEGCLTILTSLDRSLHRLARAVAETDDDAGTSDHLRRVFTKLWGRDRGNRLASEVADCYSNLESADRQVNKPASVDFIARCIESGEDAVRSWHPR